MSRTLPWSARAALFYAIAIGLAILVAALLPMGDLVWMLTMFTPLTAVVIMLVATSEARSASGWQQLGVTRLGLRMWPLALVLPACILLVAYGTVWVTGVGTFALPPTAAWAAVARNLVAGVAVGSVWAAGEELGWRGYLQPQLQALGATRAMLLTGFLHGCWHLPLVLLANVYLTAGSRWTTIPIFVALLTAAGVFYGYLRIVSGSVWPAVIAHGAFNTFLAFFGSSTVDGSPALPYVVGETGLLTLALTAVAAVWLVRRLRTMPRTGPRVVSPAPVGAAT